MLVGNALRGQQLLRNDIIRIPSLTKLSSFQRDALNVATVPEPKRRLSIVNRCQKSCLPTAQDGNARAKAVRVLLEEP